MNASRPALILVLAFLAVPALAKTPIKPVLPVALNADDLMRQAQDANAKGEKDLAVRLAQAAIVADPARPQTYDVLADIYVGQGHSDFASFYYSEALGIDPSDATATRATARLNRNGDQRAAEAATSGK
jgi:cytochrome c-type biogenesis protein CcmH/NrfG